jgi:hypothetical protein
MIVIRESFDSANSQVVTDISKLSDEEVLMGLATGSEEHRREWHARTILAEQGGEEQ